MHHGFVGGLLEHTLSLVHLCDYISWAYDIINKDLLIASAVCHDIGKTKELSSFPDNQEGMEAFVLATQRYFQYIADANRENEEKLIPDIEGWCIILGITKQTVLNYAKRSQDWADTIEYIKESILAAKKQLAFRFKIPPVVYLNDESNNHDYLNTNEFKLVTSNKNNEMTPTRTRAEIAAKYADFKELPDQEIPEL